MFSTAVNSDSIPSLNAQNSQQQHRCSPVNTSAHTYLPRTTNTHNSSVFPQTTGITQLHEHKHLQYPTPRPPEPSAVPPAKIFLKRFDAVSPVSLRLAGARRQEVTLTRSCFSSFLIFLLLLLVIRLRSGSQVPKKEGAVASDCLVCFFGGWFLSRMLGGWWVKRKGFQVGVGGG